MGFLLRYAVYKKYVKEGRVATKALFLRKMFDGVIVINRPRLYSNADVN